MIMLRISGCKIVFSRLRKIIQVKNEISIKSSMH